jgi:hypothetical protein
MVNYSILVLSCDKYSSLWDSFFERLDRHWPNDSAQRYLLTNHLNPDFPGVKNIRIGDDVDWSSNLIKALSTIESEYVYILLEDVFINRDIDQAYFKSALACIDLAKPNYVNTKALPMPRGPNHSRLVREVVKGSHYRASLCNAFWKKEMLLTLLMPGESPWEFERRGSERSNSHADFYGTVKNIMEFHHIIIGGKVARDVLNLKGISGSKILKKFPVLSRREWLSFRVSVMRNMLFSRFVPQSLQQWVRKRFE